MKEQNNREEKCNEKARRHGFSETISTKLQEDQLTEPFKKMLKEISKRIDIKYGPNISEEKRLKTTEKSTVRIQKYLDTELKDEGIGLFDALDLIPKENLNDILKQMNMDERPAPLFKFYLPFGMGKNDYPYGVNLFIFPPSCTTPPHNHTGKSKGDPCISSIRSKCPILENLILTIPDSSVAYIFWNQLRNRETLSAVLKAEQELSLNDGHQLLNEKEYNGKIKDAFKSYITSRILDSHKMTNDEKKAIEDNFVYSIHPYFGLDKNKTSSVKQCFTETKILTAIQRSLAKRAQDGDKTNLALLKISLGIYNDNNTLPKIQMCCSDDNNMPTPTPTDIGNKLPRSALAEIQNPESPSFIESRERCSSY